MSYQIRKGWPSEGALDVSLVAETGAALAGGVIAAVNNDGKAQVADYDGAGSDATLQPAFIFDVDTVTGNFVGLMSSAVIECDSECYAADTYTPNQDLTAIGGKFAAITASEPVVAKVLSFDATAGKLVVVWG